MLIIEESLRLSEVNCGSFYDSIGSAILIPPLNDIGA
jgi:hypothetical protein